MDKTSKHQFEQKTLKYIENKKVYDILENLVRKLALHKPENPIDFLIDYLTHKKPNFVIATIGVETDVHKACGNIALQLNLKHISPDDLINKEIEKNTERGKQFKQSRSQNERILEENLFDLLEAELKGVDKFVNGVLLENFPTTLKGVEFLKKHKIVVDRVFNVSDETVEEKIKQKKFSNELFDIRDVFELFEDYIVYVDSKSKSSEKVSEEIVTMLNYRVKHTPPLRPPRILVLNPPGVHFEKVGAQIAKKFGLIHVDGTSLLNKEVVNKSRIGGIISDCFQHNELVPDDLLCGLVYNELTKSTSRVLGWVLTSFPLNSEQFSKYLSWDLHPHIVLFYDAQEDTFRKLILEEANLESLNFYEQVFVKKSRKNNAFLDEFLKTSQSLKNIVKEQYSNKIDNIEQNLNEAQIVSKVGKLLQNPVYYD